MQLRVSLLVGWVLVGLALPAQARAQAQSPAQDTATPVRPETVARFKVTVSADQQIVASVYEFMTRVERRNEARLRLGSVSATPELELVHLVSTHARMAPYQRTPGVVFLRLDQAAGTASVEYCLTKCASSNPVLASYRTTIATFTKRLTEATGKLSKYRAR
jgi:hypothetical protein